MIMIKSKVMLSSYLRNVFEMDLVGCSRAVVDDPSLAFGITA